MNRDKGPSSQNLPSCSRRQDTSLEWFDRDPCRRGAPALRAGWEEGTALRPTEKLTRGLPLAVVFVTLSSFSMCRRWLTGPLGPARALQGLEVTTKDVL